MVNLIPRKSLCEWKSQISSKAFSPASLPVITRVIAASARKNTIFDTSNNITMTPISIKDLIYGATTSTHHMNSLDGAVGARRELLLDIKQLEKLLPVQKMRM